MIKKRTSFKKTLYKILSIMKDYKKDYMIIIFFCLTSAIFSSLSPLFLGYVTNSLYDSVINDLSINYSLIFKLLVIILICYLIDAVSSYARDYMSSSVGQKIGFDLRKKLVDKLNTTKLKKLDSMKKGDIISRITNDVESITDNITEVIPELIYNVSLIIAVSIMMFTLSPLMAFIIMISIPINYILLSFVVKKSQKYFKLNQAELGNVNAFIEESITNNDVIKSFNKEKYFEGKFDVISSKLRDYGYKSSFFSSLSVPFNKFIGNLSYIVIVCIGSVSVIKGNIKIGTIQSFIQYMRDFNRPMNIIAQIISNIQIAISSIDRVYEIFNLEDEENGTIKEFSFEKSIEFRNVNFSYKKNKPILKNFNLVINKGDKVALVGKTGAGKTTIVNLLMGFYTNYEGEILIDGVELKTIDKHIYREYISMVLQDTWLFEGTIKENIVYNKKISEEKLSKILSKSKILHMINSLPGGLDFTVNEEVNNISEGQKQLLTIARALVADPKILILDEATSNVDTRLEYLINHSMNNLMKNRTSLVIAHRLSTIVESDKIVVIKDGVIKEQGTHNELLENKGYYYKLYSSQFDINE